METKTFDKLTDDELLAYAVDWTCNNPREAILFHFINELKSRTEHYRTELEAEKRTSESLARQLGNERA
jgi:hypothetical protein